MSIKPILFNTDMVRAILDGRKTVTRRVFKGAPDRDDLKPYHVRGTYGLITTTNSRVYESTPPCVPGDILWVRETWAHPSIYEIAAGANPEMFLYKADDPLQPAAPGKWHPSIHMPRAAARIFLRVRDVRVERLQDIGFKGAVAEGLDPMDITPWVMAHPDHPGVDMDELVGREQDMEQRELIGRHFGKELWDSTIKSADLPLYGWDANPWVWVIEFERCERPEGWCA